MFAPPVAKPKAKTAASPNRKPAPQRATPFGHRQGHAEQAHMLWLLRLGGPGLQTNGQGSPGQSPSPFPAPRLPIQAKLKVGAVDDPLEHEADRVADQVMRMHNPRLQRACPCGGGCPKCQTEQPGRTHDRLRTKPAGPQAAAGEAPGIVHEVLRAPGQPLDPATRAFFEPRFGHDFSHVRIHADGSADSAARAVGAVAFTRGSDIVFREDQCRPHTFAGRQLLAHELTHVVQQSGAVARRAPSDSLTVTAVNDPSEREADAMADVALRRDAMRPLDRGGSTASVRSSAPRVALQRTPESEPGPDEGDASSVREQIADGSAQPGTEQAKGGEVVYSSARSPDEEPLIKAAGKVPEDTVECVSKWTPCRAPYSPGSWGLRITYHCPRLILPWMIIIPGTTRAAYVTVPDEFTGVDSTGRDMYRCRPGSSVRSKSDIADSVAFALTRSTLYPGQDACHAGFRAFLHLALEAMFLPSGGGRPAGIRVNAPPPPATHPCP